jgi:hypothetical protein
VQGENVDVELGYLAGLETHPRRVEFETVLAMNDGDRATFQTDVVDALESMAGDILPIENAVAARCRGSDAATAPWCNELWDGISIVRLRAEHAAHLYRAILDKAAGTDGTAEYNAALGVTTEAAAVIARREAHYRFDLSRMVDDYTNPTVYQFGDAVNSRSPRCSRPASPPACSPCRAARTDDAYPSLAGTFHHPPPSATQRATVSWSLCATTWT